VWIAHALTLARIPIAIGFWLAYGHVAWMVGLVALAALTDTLDGTVARALKRRGARGPDIGGWLDPLIDKIFVAVAIAAIGWHTRAWLALGLVGARELLFVPLAALYVAKRVPARELHADPLGKAATVAQFVALAVIVAAPAWGVVAGAGAALLGIAAVGHYVRALLARRAVS
jgi:phosphatidylglycerophosphate synthase